MAGDPTYWRRRPQAPAPGTALSPLSDLVEGQGKEFVFGDGKGAFAMVVVRRGSDVFGYVNVCPHFNLPLNHRSNEFLNEDGSLIRCSMHMAEFRIHDGHCVFGAAIGCDLDPVPLEIRDGCVFIQPDPVEPE